jgi:hypothetical protein
MRSRNVVHYSRREQWVFFLVGNGKVTSSKSRAEGGMSCTERPIKWCLGRSEAEVQLSRSKDRDGGVISALHARGSETLRCDSPVLIAMLSGVFAICMVLSSSLSISYSIHLASSRSSTEASRFNVRSPLDMQVTAQISRIDRPCTLSGCADAQPQHTITMPPLHWWTRLVPTRCGVIGCPHTLCAVSTWLLAIGRNDQHSVLGGTRDIRPCAISH